MSGNSTDKTRNVISFDHLGMDDVPEVGGKNASLGEMVVNLADAGVHVPGGFATTADAYRDFLALDGLDRKISEALADLDIDNVNELTKRGEQIRQWILDQPFPEALEQDIRDNYADLVDNDPHPEEVTWAVRSSATAEDLPDASFAGQQETYLNIGGIDNILEAVKWVFASLYNDRAIAYRVHHGFHHDDVALSAGVQRMVRTDIGASGVMFTVDTESGFDRAVFVTASYGLGEAVVQGAVNPDEFYVSKPAVRDGKTGKDAVLSRTVGGKAVAMRYAEGTGIETATRWEDVAEDDRNRFCITDEQVTELARHAVAIEDHYGRPMDIEWGLDGQDGQLYILQARPETVVSRREGQSLSRFEFAADATTGAEVLVE
jgi:pyruvate,water dikinase